MPPPCEAPTGPLHVGGAGERGSQAHTLQAGARSVAAPGKQTPVDATRHSLCDRHARLAPAGWGPGLPSPLDLGGQGLPQRIAGLALRAGSPVGSETWSGGFPPPPALPQDSRISQGLFFPYYQGASTRQGPPRPQLAPAPTPPGWEGGNGKDALSTCLAPGAGADHFRPLPRAPAVAGLQDRGAGALARPTGAAQGARGRRVAGRRRRVGRGGVKGFGSH